MRRYKVIRGDVVVGETMSVAEVAELLPVMYLREDAGDDGAAAGTSW